MCGIHGFVTGKKRNVNGDDFVGNGFVAGSLRGTDSSGIASIKLDVGEIDYQKLPISGPMFMQERFAGQLITAASNVDTITICHTRAATSGKIGINEAHPFFVDDEATGRELIGVHNGTLTQWWHKPGAKDFKVDSEWALNHIFKEAFDAFEDFTGAFVFVWWDSADKNHLNIALNDERPMYVAFTKDDGMAYASEPGMLYWLCERNRIQLTGPVLQLTGGHWYKFNAYNLSGYTKAALPKPKSVVQTSTSYNSRSNYHGTHKTVMTKVKELLDGIAGQESSNVSNLHTLPTSLVPAQLPAPMPIVTQSEAQNARDLLMMGERGQFIPNWLDEQTGEVSGTFTQGTRGELDAIIRNGSLLKFDVDSIWSVTCIGVIDNGRDMILVCDKPVVTQARPLSAVH